MSRVATNVGSEYRRPSLADPLQDFFDRFATPTASAMQDLPASWRGSFITRVPVAKAWAKRIHRVTPTASAARHYVGEYIQDRTHMYIGNLVLICTAEPRMLVLYLYMPDNFWYRIKTAPTAYDIGWGMVLRSAARSWLALSYRHRIVRACIEILLDVRNARRMTMQQIWSHRQSEATTPLVALQQKHHELVAITTRFETTLQTAVDALPDPRLSLLRQSFDGWLEDIERATDTSRSAVLHAVRTIVNDDRRSDILIDDMFSLLADIGATTSGPATDDSTIEARLSRLRDVVTAIARQHRGLQTTIQNLQAAPPEVPAVINQTRQLRNVRIKGKKS